MKNILLNEIYDSIKDLVSMELWEQMQPRIRTCLETVRVEPIRKSELSTENMMYLDMYLAAKHIEGCSEKTLHHYRLIIERYLMNTDCMITDITTADIRKYLSEYQRTHDVNHVSMDNLRRVISGFFTWLEDEDYIIKSPTRRIHKVKSDKIVKNTFSDEHIEKLRGACQGIRDLVLIEFLASTGVRVGELVKLNRADINFIERSCIVFGKGNKEREVYFDARTKLHLEEYLAERTDKNPALFVGEKAPYDRMTISGIEKTLHRIGNRCGMEEVHPHKFRRTLATVAIDKGMPIEQVQTLLGHVRIDTTMEYAMVNQQNVKNSHRKYIG